MKCGKIGPWKESEWRAFVDLAWSAKLPPQPLNRLRWLDPRIKAEDEQSHVENVWTQLKVHPVFKWLEANPHFQNAWRTFQRRQQRPNAKAVSPRAEIEFAMMFAFHGGRYFSLKDGSPRRDATVRTREKALRAANVLVSERSNGLRLADHAEDEQLFRLVTKLLSELSTVRRKKRHDKRTLERDCIVGFVVISLLTLGYSSPAILSDFAHMIGAGIDPSSANRYSKAADQQHRIMLAEALQKYGQNSSQ